MEDKYDLELINKFGEFFNYKIFFLPSSIMLPLLIISEKFQNNFYIFFSTFVSLCIIGWNFPKFTKLYYSRPIYFEDLEDKQYEVNKVKNKILYNIELSNKFKRIFLIIQQLLISATCAILIDYIVIKSRENTYNTMELFGLVGGIISLLIKIIRILGKILLSFLYYKKKKEKENLLIKYNLN